MRIASSCIALLLLPAVLSGCASAARVVDVGRASPMHASRPALHHTESPRARTVQLVEHLLAEVRLPSGARARSSAPVRELRGPGQSAASSNLVDRHHWWTSTSSETAVLHYMKLHAPQGCRFEGSGTATGPHQATVHDILCDENSTTYAGNPGVVVEAVRAAHGSAVRADAQAIWIPARPAWSRVVDPSSAAVVVERHGSSARKGLPTKRVTLDAKDAARLATVLDRQGETTPGTYSCPIDLAGVEDRLAFTTTSGRIKVTVGLTGCPAVIVSVPGHHSVSLTGTGSLDEAIVRVLHLPERYRY